MKLNRKWLNEEFVDLSHVSDKEFVEKLTIFGQKVETYEPGYSNTTTGKTGPTWLEEKGFTYSRPSSM